MKFSVAPFTISKEYEMKLHNKVVRFAEHTRGRKSLMLTLVTTYGVTRSQHSGVVQAEITLDDLFGQGQQ